MRGHRSLRLAALALVLCAAVAPQASGSASTAHSIDAWTATVGSVDPPRPYWMTDYQWRQTLDALRRIDQLKHLLLPPDDVAGIPDDVLREEQPLGHRFKVGVYDSAWAAWIRSSGGFDLDKWSPKVSSQHLPTEIVSALEEADRYGRMVVMRPEDKPAVPGQQDKSIDSIIRKAPDDPGKKTEIKVLGGGKTPSTNGETTAKSMIRDASRQFSVDSPGPSGGTILLDLRGAQLKGTPMSLMKLARILKGQGVEYQRQGGYKAELTFEAQFDETTKVVWDGPETLIVEGERHTGLRTRTAFCDGGGQDSEARPSSSRPSEVVAIPRVRFAAAVTSGPCDPQEESAPSPTPAPRGLATPNLQASLTDAEKLGGIDFTSMELRYLSVAPSDDGTEVSSAFRAHDTGGTGNNGSVVDGVRSAVQASDAFFVWLALPQDKFWVNLNPDEPDRIMDSAFGRTEAGRVLLESDFLLKRVDYELMDPNTALGDRYWDQLRPGSDGSYCTTYRVWIVPGTAKVRETEDSIYVVDAPLDVKVRRDQIASAGCGQQPKSTQMHNAGVYRRLLLPKVKQAVNNSPEFASLRRVYLSRVVAEWYRQNSASVPSEYIDIIDSGNLGRWQLSGSWRPRQTFDEYVRSFDSGEFDYRKRVVEGNLVKTYVYRTGGVDFTRLFKQNLTADAFESIAPGLTETVAKGLDQPTVDPRTNDRWLGGTSEIESAAEEPTPPADEAAGRLAPDDPWSRDSAPYVVPLMLLAGAGLIGWAVVRERGRHATRGPR